MIRWTRVRRIFLTTLDTFSQRKMILSDLINLISTQMQAHKVAQLVVQHRDNTSVAGAAWGALEFGAYRICNLPPIENFREHECRRSRAKQAHLLPCALKPTSHCRRLRSSTYANATNAAWPCWSPAPFMDFLMSHTIQSHARL